MLTSNTMRFCTDIFGLTVEDSESESGGGGSTAAFVKKALLVSKTALDCTNKSSVQQIIISGVQPSGTDRRFMFRIDNKNYKFTGSTLVEYTGNLTTDNVLSNGNTAAQLQALSSVPGFVGKNIYPIIALKAPSTSEDAPTVKLQLKTQASADTLTSTKTSIVTELVDDDSTPVITELTPDFTLKGNATCTVKIRLRVNGTWTNYMVLEDALEKEAQAVQFQVTYKVTKTDGTDSAKLNSVTVGHTLGKAVVADGNADIYTKVADYDNDLQYCYVTVKHAPLNDSYLEAYVNFMKPPKHRDLISIGVGNGARQEFTLGLNGTPDARIDTTTLRLFEGATELSEFNFNSATATVNLIGKKDVTYFASYDYEYSVENWSKMTPEETEPFNDETGLQTSRFSYKLQDTAGMTTSSVRLRLVRPTGDVKNYSLGKATGKMQLFVLPHIPKMSTIKFSKTVEWDLDEDNNILSVIAAKNTALSVSYSWAGENITVHSLACGWACA